MLIQFKLQGTIREIRWDGKCFSAQDPNSETGVLGFYTNIGNAVLCHIKDAARLDTSKTEEVIELKDLADRFKKLFDEVRGVSEAEIISTTKVIPSTMKGSHLMKDKADANKDTEKPEPEDDLDL